MAQDSRSTPTVSRNRLLSRLARSRFYTGSIGRPVATASIALALAACGGGGGGAPGTLLLPYQLGNSLLCADPNINVVQVRATLDGGAYEKTAPCDDSGQIRIDEVDPGTWEIVLEAIDPKGVIVMDNRGQNPLPVAEVLGDGATTTAQHIALTSVPAHILLRWSTGFENCSTVGISSFRVSVWDSLGTTELMSGELDCNAPPDTDNSFRRLPDPERRINGTVVQGLSVTPLDANGVVVGNIVRFDLARTPGAGYSILASLQCDGAQGCIAAGEAAIAP